MPLTGMAVMFDAFVALNLVASVFLEQTKEYMTGAVWKYLAMCMQAGDIHDSDEPGAGVVMLGVRTAL